MSRSLWTVDRLESGNTWVSATAIYRPNQNTDVADISNQIETQLANGAFSLVAPENVYVRDKIQMTWEGLDTTVTDDATFITTIKNYARNGDYLRITAHNSETYIGVFINPKRVWLTGFTADAYDLQAVFFRFSGSD